MGGGAGVMDDRQHFIGTLSSVDTIFCKSPHISVFVQYHRFDFWYPCSILICEGVMNSLRTPPHHEELVNRRSLTFSVRSTILFWRYIGGLDSLSRSQLAVHTLVCSPEPITLRRPDFKASLPWSILLQI